MNQDSRILAAHLDDLVWLRVIGKGTFQNSPNLKHYADACIGDNQLRFVIDLEDCTGMDSTFMGTLTGLALELARRQPDGGAVHVVNANGRNRQLLQNLGLDQVIDLDVDGSTWKTQRDLVSRVFMHRSSDLPETKISAVERAEHVLAAHQALGTANEENTPRFKDVVNFLRQDLDGKRSESSGE